MTNKITITNKDKSIVIQIESQDEEFLYNLSREAKRFFNLGDAFLKLDNLCNMCRNCYKYEVLPQEGELRECFDLLPGKYKDIDKEIIKDIIIDVTWAIASYIYEIKELLDLE